MAGLCEGKVAVVTGAGRGIGRGHALELARQGAKVVVNDLGAEVDGTGSSKGPAQSVVDEIVALGGEAVVNGDDVSDWKGSERMIQTAIERFGKLDVLVNNAGILRDRMIFNMTEAEWDGVIAVHLKGTFCPTRHACAYWREQSKSSGGSVNGRIVSTSSVSGLFGNPGQANYGAAKAGIAAFTIIVAREMQRFGVTANAVSPGAQTRMTTNLGGGGGGGQAAEPVPGEWSARDPENVAPVVAWLASDEASEVTGQVFSVSGGRVGVMEGWAQGPTAAQDSRWDPVDLGPVIKDLLGKARQPASMGGRPRGQNR